MGWWHRLTNAMRSGRVERDIRREVSFHITERTDDLRAEGFSDEEASRRARAAFGNPTLQAEQTRDADVARVADTFLRDLRYAVRTLARTPGFTLAAVATLALGIGANTVVFSALDTVLLRPLPFPEADRLVAVRQTQDGRSETFIAPPRLADWNGLNSAFAAITGYYMDDVAETSGDFPERVRRAFVTPHFTEVWGVPPAIGRAFTAEEHRFGGPAAVVISERYWRTRLAADPNVLQRSVRIGSAPVPVIGVMPSTFRFPDPNVDLWSPSRDDAPYAQSRTSTWYTAIGRMGEGVTPAQAQENLRAIQARLAAQYPDSDRGIGVEVVPLKERTVADAGAEGDPLARVPDVRLKMRALEPLRSVYEIAPLEARLGDAFAEKRLRTALLVLFAASALSLSVVGLYGTLSYVVGLRRREVGLRLALGAGRRRIVSQFALLGMRVVGLACVVGLGLALAGTRVLSGMLFGVTPSDPLTFFGVVSIVIAIAALAVLIPAVRAACLEPMRVLREQ